MPKHIPTLADPPSEDLDSLEPVCQHASTWRSRLARKRARNERRQKSPSLPPAQTEAPGDTNKDIGRTVSKVYTDPSDPLEIRLNQLEEVVRDCAVLLRSSVVGRLDKLEKNLADESTRLDERLDNEARRRCRLLTEITVKVSAAIDQLRLEAKSAST